MTRINCIPPSELTNKHLLAEYRELPRVFKLARLCDDIPLSYTMGKGHVKFFYNKLSYLIRRQRGIIDELLARGYKPQHTNLVELMARNTTRELYNDWEPDSIALQTNRQRIKERLGTV